MQSGYTMAQLQQIGEQDMHYVELIGYGFTKLTVGWVKGQDKAMAIRRFWDSIIDNASPEEAEEETYDFIQNYDQEKQA